MWPRFCGSGSVLPLWSSCTYGMDSEEWIMKRKLLMSVSLSLVFGMLVSPVFAAKKWKSLVPFTKKVEANPDRNYELEDINGPWMILAASFSGEDGLRQADQLTLELRRSLNRPVYVHRRVFDFTAPVQGIGLNKYNEPRQMKYRQDKRFNEVAVLVGDFDSAESHDIQETLEELRTAWPPSLDYRRNQETSQRFVGLKNAYRTLSGNSSKKKMGPMSNAFVTRNPLLPAEYFAPKGIDSFVVKLNKKNRLNLLDNPAAYSVKIASFRGKSTMKISEADSIGKRAATLDKAADDANRLGAALRSRGVEAWVLHDRFESIVTVGSFSEVGRPRQDGKIEMHPGVHQVIQQYKGRHIQVRGAVAVKPVVIAGISCDVQPQPVMIPRQSATAEYARGLGLFR